MAVGLFSTIGSEMVAGEWLKGSLSIQEVKEELRRLIADFAKLASVSITDSSTLDQDIQMPSIRFLEFQTTVEETFDIELDAAEVIEQNTFGKVATLIWTKIESSEC
jgi:acyl carrier protein